MIRYVFPVLADKIGNEYTFSFNREMSYLDAVSTMLALAEEGFYLEGLYEHTNTLKPAYELSKLKV